MPTTVSISVPDISIVVIPTPIVEVVVAPMPAVTIAAMPAVVISGDAGSIDRHNVSASSHQDLRTAIGNKASPYTHVQSTLSGAWLINHNLGRSPSISISDSDGNQVWGGVVHHPPFNSSSVTFAFALAGTAYCI